MSGSGRRALLASCLAVALGAAVLPLARGPVDGELAGQARQALREAGVEGVAVRSDWAALELSGPPAQRRRALAAVADLADQAAVDTVGYRSLTPTASVSGPAAGPVGSATATGGPTVAPVAVRLDLTSDRGRRVVELSGRLATGRQRSALLVAVMVGGPDLRVRDRSTAAEGEVSDGARTAFPTFLRIAREAAAGLRSGRVALTEGTLELTGVAVDEQVAARVDELVRQARARGVTVSGQVVGPVGLAAARLADVPGLSQVQLGSRGQRLTKASRRALVAAAAVLRSLPGVVVEIRGYPAGRRPSAADIVVARRTAELVRDYLVERGVPPDRLRAVGAAAGQRTADDDGRSGRRIEFVVKES